MSYKYNGVSDRRALDLRERQIEYLCHRLDIAEKSMAAVWSLTGIPNGGEFAYCIKGYRDQYPEAIGLWNGSDGIPVENPDLITPKEFKIILDKARAYMDNEEAMPDGKLLKKIMRLLGE